MNRPGLPLPTSTLVSLAALLATGLALLPAGRPPASFDDGPFRPGRFVVDGVHSSVVFSLTHLDVARFYGRFNSVSGSFVLDLEDPAGSSVDLSIDPASVDTNHEGRDRHVKSADFLHVEEHTELGFRSTAVERTGDRRLAVTGELTVHGVTRPVTAEVELVGAAETPFGDFRTGVEARFRVDRREFGISTYEGSLGAQIDFIVSLEAVLEGSREELDSASDGSDDDG